MNVASRVWELLAEPRSLSAISDALAEEYEVDPTTCGEQVGKLIADLVLRRAWSDASWLSRRSECGRGVEPSRSSSKRSKPQARLAREHRQAAGKLDAAMRWRCVRAISGR
jgi:hypothetical protein